MKNKGMQRIRKIFSKLNKVNVELDVAIAINKKDELKELKKIEEAEKALLNFKELTEARVAMSQKNTELLQETSNKASLLMKNLDTLMNDDITEIKTK